MNIDFRLALLDCFHPWGWEAIEIEEMNGNEHSNCHENIKELWQNMSNLPKVSVIKQGAARPSSLLCDPKLLQSWHGVPPAFIFNSCGVSPLGTLGQYF